MVKFLIPLLIVTGLAGQDPYKPGQGASMPVLISQTAPNYTRDAQVARLEGALVLAVVIDGKGRISQARVVSGQLVQGANRTETNEDLGLGEQALKAVKKWKFKPGEKDGKPVSVMANVVVNFRLK